MKMNTDQVHNTIRNLLPIFSHLSHANNKVKVPDTQHLDIYDPVAHLNPPPFSRLLNLDPLNQTPTHVASPSTHVYSPTTNYQAPTQHDTDIGRRKALQHGRTITTNTPGRSCFPRVPDSATCTYTPVLQHNHLHMPPIKPLTGRPLDISKWWTPDITPQQARENHYAHEHEDIFTHQDDNSIHTRQQPKCHPFPMVFTWVGDTIDDGNGFYIQHIVHHCQPTTPTEGRHHTISATTPISYKYTIGNTNGHEDGFTYIENIFGRLVSVAPRHYPPHNIHQTRPHYQSPPLQHLFGRDISEHRVSTTQPSLSNRRFMTLPPAVNIHTIAQPPQPPPPPPPQQQD